MDQFDNLSQFLISFFSFITHWSDYQDDLRQANPKRRAIIVLLLFAICLCASACCLVFFSDKIANFNSSGIPVP
jgi:hypothetical protein